MSPLSFGFAYPRMSAEVIGCSIAIANDSPKLATTIAIKLLVLPSQKNNPAENKTSIVIRIFLLYLSQIFPIKILTKYGNLITANRIAISERERLFCIATSGIKRNPT